MPLSAANTRAACADRGRNALVNNAKGSNPSAGGQMNVRLVFEGVSGKAEDLFDALEAKYGAGKVTTDHDSLAGNRLQFRVRP